MAYKTLFLDCAPVQLAVYDELVSRGIPGSTNVRSQLEKGHYLSIKNNKVYYTINSIKKDEMKEHYGPVTVEEMLAIKPTKVTVVLNGDYTATVTKDEITVGCQTFDPAILTKLVKAHEAVSSDDTRARERFRNRKGLPRGQTAHRTSL